MKSRRKFSFYFPTHLIETIDSISFNGLPVSRNKKLELIIKKGLKKYVHDDEPFSS